MLARLGLPVCFLVALLVAAVPAGAATRCGDLGRAASYPVDIAASGVSCRTARVVARRCFDEFTVNRCTAAGITWKVTMRSVRAGGQPVGFRIRCTAGGRVVAWTQYADD